MKTYKQWVKDNNPGNYVSVDVTGLPTRLVAALPGKVTPEPHITLMYSKESHVPLEHINHVLKRRSLDGANIPVVGVEIFDSQPKEGEPDQKLGCLVLKVNSPQINEINSHLTRIGCKHSYTPFQAHATLIYDCPMEQCKIAIKEIQRHIDSDGIFLTGGKFNNQWIKENWVDSTTK